MSDTPKICKTCRHWQITERQRKATTRNLETGTRSCREGAPIGDFKWPLTFEDDGCSKWEPSAQALGVRIPEEQPGLPVKQKRARPDPKQAELG
jgi:hypothetical protein